MPVANRGWTNFENAATALEVDIRFGNDLVAKESSVTGSKYEELWQFLNKEHEFLRDNES